MLQAPEYPTSKASPASVPGGGGEDPTRLRAQAADCRRGRPDRFRPSRSGALDRPGPPFLESGSPGASGQRAETMRRHWASTSGPKARTSDSSLDRECRRIKRAVPTWNSALFNSYGGVTAALKRAVKLQPAAEGRSFQVVIDGKHTWQSQRLTEARFDCA